MNPNNIPCLHAANIDVVSLANNHVLDWGYAGLQETLETLHAAGIQTVGAGTNEETASHPAILKKPPSIPGEQERRVLVFAWGSPCAGVPEIWAATASRPGIAMPQHQTSLHNIFPILTMNEKLSCKGVIYFSM